MSTDGWHTPGGGGGGGGPATVTTDGDTIQGTGAPTSPIALRQVHVGGGLSGTGTAGNPLVATGGGGGGGGAGAGSLCPANPTFIFFPPGNTIIGNDGAGHVIYDNIGGFVYDGSVAGQIDGWNDSANSPPQYIPFTSNGNPGQTSYDAARKMLKLPNQWSGIGGSVALSQTRATIAWIGAMNTAPGWGGLFNWGNHTVMGSFPNGTDIAIATDSFTFNGTVPNAQGGIFALLLDITPPNINVYYSRGTFTQWILFASSAAWPEPLNTGAVGIGNSADGGPSYRNGERETGMYGYWPRGLSGTIAGTAPTGEYLNLLNMLVSLSPQPPFASALEGSLASQGAMNQALVNQIVNMSQGAYLPALPGTEALPSFWGAPDATRPLINAAGRHGHLLFPPNQAWAFNGVGNWGYTINSPITMQPAAYWRGMNSYLFAGGGFSSGGLYGDSRLASALPMILHGANDGAQFNAVQTIDSINVNGQFQPCVGMLNSNSCRSRQVATAALFCWVGYVDLNPQYSNRHYRYAYACPVGFQISNDQGGGAVDYQDTSGMTISWNGGDTTQAAGVEGYGFVFCGDSGTSGSTGGGVPMDLYCRESRGATGMAASISPNSRFWARIDNGTPGTPGNKLTVTKWLYGPALRWGDWVNSGPGAPTWDQWQHQVTDVVWGGSGFTGTYNISGPAVSVANQVFQNGRSYWPETRLYSGNSEYGWNGQGGDYEWSPTFHWWAPGNTFGTWPGAPGYAGNWSSTYTYGFGDVIDFGWANGQMYVSMQAGNLNNVPAYQEYSGGPYIEINQQWWINIKAYGTWAPFRGRGGTIYMQTGALHLIDTAHNDAGTVMFAVMEDGTYIEANSASYGGNGTLKYAFRAKGPNAKVDFRGPVKGTYGLQTPIHENVGQRPNRIDVGYVAGYYGSAQSGAGPSPMVFSCFGPAKYRADWAAPNPHASYSIGSSPWTNNTNFTVWVTFTGGTGVVVSIGGAALPSGIHLAGPIVVPAGASLSWTSTTAPTVKYALPLGCEFSPINSHGNAIGPDRYVVPMTGSTSNVVIDKATDSDATIQGTTIAGTPPWVDQFGGSGGLPQEVGRITFAAGSDPVLDYAYTPYGSGGGSPINFGDLGPGAVGSGATGFLHLYMGMEFKLLTVPPADPQDGDSPGYSYVRICPTLAQGGVERRVDGGSGNVHGCSRYLNKNVYTPTLPAGPTYSGFNCTATVTAGSTAMTVTATDHPLINGSMIWDGGTLVNAWTTIASGPTGGGPGSYTLNQAARSSGTATFLVNNVEMVGDWWFGHDFSNHPGGVDRQGGNVFFRFTGGTNVVVKQGIQSGYVRQYDNDCNLIGYTTGGNPVNLGSGGGVFLTINNLSSQDFTISYTTAPTVQIWCATPSGVTLWPGMWMWVPIYSFFTGDFQYSISLVQKPTVPITILYRKFAYVRAKHSQLAQLGDFFHEGAWF